MSLFDKVRFGDSYKTRDGRRAVFIRYRDLIPHYVMMVEYGVRDKQMPFYIYCDSKGRTMASLEQNIDIVEREK